MVVTYFSSATKLFDGPAQSGVPGEWVRVRQAKQIRLWAKASSAVNIAVRVSIFPPSGHWNGPVRETDFIESSPVGVGTSWSEVLIPELDGPIDSVCVVPLGNDGDLKVYISGSAI